jgi:hypothetical protein
METPATPFEGEAGAGAKCIELKKMYKCLKWGDE